MSKYVLFLPEGKGEPDGAFDTMAEALTAKGEAVTKLDEGETDRAIITLVTDDDSALDFNERVALRYEEEEVTIVAKRAKDERLAAKHAPRPAGRSDKPRPGHRAQATATTEKEPEKAPASTSTTSTQSREPSKANS